MIHTLLLQIGALLVAGVGYMVAKYLWFHPIPKPQPPEPDPVAELKASIADEEAAWIKELEASTGKRYLHGKLVSAEEFNTLVSPNRLYLGIGSLGPGLGEYIKTSLEFQQEMERRNREQYLAQQQQQVNNQAALRAQGTWDNLGPWDSLNNSRKKPS